MSGRIPAACPFEDDVLALDDGTLETTRRMVVEAHLAVCASCADLEETLDRAAAAMRGAAVPPLGSVEAALAMIPARPAIRPALRNAAAATLVAIVAAFVTTIVATRDRGRIGPADRDLPQAPRERPPAGGAGDEPPRDAPADDLSNDPLDSPLSKLSVAAPADPSSVSPEGAIPYVARSLEDLPRLIGDVDPDAAAGDANLDLAVRRVRGAGTAGACAIAALLEGADRDADLARRALRVAADVPSTQYAAPLGRLLDDAEFGPLAARQLGAMTAPAAVEQLAIGLGGPSRAAALDALAASRSPRAFDVLAARVRSGDDAMPSQVLDAAVTASPAHAARLLLELAASPDLAPVAERMLRERRDVLVPALVPLTAKSDVLVAAAAIRALGFAGDPSAIPALRTAGTRFALARPAAEALARIGTDASFAAAFDVASDPRAPKGLLDVFDDARAAAPVLARSLSDARSGRRAAAVEALGRTGSEDAVADLARATEDPSLRRAAIEALGRVGGDGAAAVLVESANPRTADLALVRALGAAGSAVAVPALRTLAREPALCVGAAESLGRIADRESVLALADLLAEPRAARAAGESLGALPASVVVPALLDRLDDPAAAGRAHRALVLVAGADLGRAPAAWRTWWKDRRPLSPEEPR